MHSLSGGFQAARVSNSTGTCVLEAASSSAISLCVSIILAQNVYTLEFYFDCKKWKVGTSFMTICGTDGEINTEQFIAIQ